MASRRFPRRLKIAMGGRGAHIYQFFRRLEYLLRWAAIMHLCISKVALRQFVLFDVAWLDASMMPTADLFRVAILV
jgi:hypothetical protein